MTCGFRMHARRALMLAGAALAVRGAAASLAAQSQATTGIIRGVVADPTGNPVSGANVTVRDLETNFTRRLATDEKGVFVASLLPLGTYEVTAKAVGFSQATKTGIPVRVGETVDLKLAVAAGEGAPRVGGGEEDPLEAPQGAAPDP